MYAKAKRLTQWGSCDLGERGYSPIEILRYFYGSDLYINTAEAISGIPASWPGEDLVIGSSGNKVRQIQEQLDRRRWDLRPGHSQGGGGVPVGLRPSGDGNGGFFHLV